MKQISCKKRVAVIGGGVSGLTAAYELRNDYDVDVFEASSRLGGRMKTVIIDGKRYEAGGQAVGRNHEETRKLSKELNVELVKNVDCWNNCHFQYSNGDIIKNYDFDGFPNYPALDCIHEKRLNYNRSLFSSNYLWENTVEKLLKDCHASERLVDVAVTAIRVNVGSEINKVEAVNLFESAYWGFEEGIDSWKREIGIKLGLIDDDLVFDAWKTYPPYDEEFMFKHGTIDLIRALEAKLKPDSINLKATLTKIKTFKNKVLLTFSDNKTLKYDAVIITIPISAMKNIKFSKNLSKSMSSPLKKFIKTRSMASHAKIFLEFDAPWWNGLMERTDGSAFSFQTKDVLVGSYWQFDSEQTGKHSLMGYVGGDQVKHLKTKKSADDFARRVVSQMTGSLQFLGKERNIHFNPYLHFLRGVVTKIWVDDEFFGGSYTAKAMNEEMAKGQTKTSIRKGRIQFAGEAWSEDFFGYIEGAIETGIKAAKRFSNKI